MISTRHLPQHEVEFKSELSPFEMIYLAAKHKNEEMLARALIWVDIDVCNENGLETPLSKLAAENDKESVNFLIKFNASLTWAIQGFAQGGYIEEALALFEKNRPFKDREEVVSMRDALMFGLALGGDEIVSDAFLKHQESRYTEWSTRARGLALCKTETKVYAFLEKVKREHPGVVSFVLQKMLRSLAQNGRETEVYALVEELKIDRPDDVFSLWWDAIGIGLGQGGHEKKAYAFLEKVKLEDPFNFDDVLSGIGFGFSRGGHKTKAYAFLEKVKLEHSNVNSVLERVLKSMAVGFFHSGYKKEVSLLLDRLANEYPAYAIDVLRRIKKTSNKYKSYNLDAVILKTLTMSKDSPTRWSHKVELELDFPNLTMLFKRAEKCSSLMRSEQITYQQALGWIQPEMFIVLMQGIALLTKKKKSSNLQKLPLNLFLSIANYLSPMPFPDMIDLSNKFVMKTCRARFFNNLKKDQTLLVADRSMAPLESEQDKSSGKDNSFVKRVKRGPE